MNKIIALSGPTASGKTGWSLELAKSHNGVIICADSRTVYRELNLGAAKVTAEFPATWRDTANGPIAVVEGIDHYGLNLADLTQRYAVGEFQQYVYGILPTIWESGRQPIIVGGTGLYVSAVLEGYTFHGRYSKERKDPGFLSLSIVIDRPRDELYRRIDMRVDERLAQGMLDEVRALIAEGRTKRLLGLGLEYRVLTEYLLGEETPERLNAYIVRLKGEIHAYARRQLTWWRHRANAQWVSGYTELVQQVDTFLAS